MVNFSSLLSRTRAAFESGKTRDVEWRKTQLLGLINMLEKEADGFCDALYKDLRKHKHEAMFMEVNLTKNDAIAAYNNLKEWVKPQKPRHESLGMEINFTRNDAIFVYNHLDEWIQKQKPKHEAYTTEIYLSKNEAILAYNSLDEWAKAEQVKTNLLTMTDTCFVQNEPYGVSLIIGAWNYPVQLVLLPLVGCIAAGNCCIMKPSEVAETTANFLEQVLPRYLDSDCFHIVNGGIPETTALIAERFDHIFYTGNSTVAKIVYEAAAKNLTPVILELGGKSPVYVDESSDMDLAARRILWGKFVNSGQTCIAPDYVMCKADVQDKLIKQLDINLKKFYGEDAQQSDSLGRIINDRHFSRLKNLFSDANIAIGGKVDEKDKYIEPTVLRDCKATDPAMKDEIFGPVLPVMPVKDADEAINFINSRDKPLAMYVFSKNKSQVEKMIQNTSSGGVTVNDTVMHAALETLPFGGVGNSGQGSYHGKFSYDAFSHKKPVMMRPQSMEFINDLRYPPYTQKKTGLIAWVMGKKVRNNRGIFGSLFGMVKVVVLGVLIGFFAKQLGLDKYLPESIK